MVFNVTKDAKSLEILQLLKDCRLEKYCSEHLEHVIIHGALQFLFNLNQDKDGNMVTSLDDEEMVVTDDNIFKVLRLRSGSRLPEKYRIGEESAILDEVLRLVKKVV